MRQKTFDFIPGQKVNATRQCWIMQKQLVYLTILFTILFSILFLDPPGTFMGYAITSFDYFLYLTFDWWLKYMFELVYNRNVKGHYNPYLNGDSYLPKRLVEVCVVYTKSLTAEMCPFPMFVLFSNWNRDSFVFTAAMRNRSIYHNQLFLPENTAEIERSRVLKIFPFSPSPQMSIWKSRTPDMKLRKELGLVLGPAAYCRLWSVPRGRTLGRRLPGLIPRPAGQVPTQ